MNINGQFDVTGLFYEKNEYKFRKYLDIRKKDVLINEIDLMVVMMNPGSSRPLDDIDNNTIEVGAVPDRTQKQIMKIMFSCGYNYARILNLSDLRESKSELFYAKLKELKSRGICHSIFDDERKGEFLRLFNENVPVILGWGVDRKLKELALNALEKIKNKVVIGLQKENLNYAYYHPLPQIHSKQVEWIDKVKILLTSKTSNSKVNDIHNLWSKYNFYTNKLSKALGRTNNIVGEYAEFLAHELYGGELLNISSESADIKNNDGTLYQVKSRKISKLTSTQLSVIRSWKFHILVVILFNHEGDILKALEVPVDTAKKHSMKNLHQNGWIISTSKKFLEDANNKDITSLMKRMINKKE